MPLARPLALGEGAEYAARLGNVAYWTPYVAEVLRRHGLPEAPLATGTRGSFPTVLAGAFVVKLFPEELTGGACCAAERDVHDVARRAGEVVVPPILATGELFDARDGWAWPYIVTSRMRGSSWRLARLSAEDELRVARQLGVAVARVHRLPPPVGPLWDHDLLRDLRATCVERHRAWRTLPSHLIAQIDDFLVPPSIVRQLVHADLHADHVFVEDGALAGLIDWGDAVVADPYYELPALHLGTFDGRLPLLREFLAGYAWDVHTDFAPRAMTMTLLHQFDVLAPLAATRALDDVATLEVLAQRLWGV